MRSVLGCCAGGVAQLDQIGLRLEHEDRDVEIGADPQVRGTETEVTDPP